MKSTSPHPYAIRAANSNDWDAIAALINLTETYGVTGDILRGRLEKWVEGDPRLDLVAEDLNNEIVGFANSYRKAADIEGKFTGIVHIRPDASGMGLGRDLLGRAQAFAISNGGTHFVSYVREDSTRGIAFAENAGFKKLQRLFESELDLAAFEPNPLSGILKRLEDEGYRFLSLADAGDTDENRRRIHALDNETDTDTPGYENWGYRPYDRYHIEEFEAPGYDAHAVIIAEFAGEWVAMNSIRPTPIPRTWHTEYTGVLREHRGKGLAQAVKLLGILYAKNAGAAILKTNNDDRNAPMIAVNAKLGFREEPGFYIYKKDCAT